MYLFKWHCHANAAGALYTVNKVPGYNIGGNSELATSGPKKSSENEMSMSHKRLEQFLCDWQGMFNWWPS